MNLSTLKSLQKRIQEATGADRELDWIIANTFKVYVGGVKFRDEPQAANFTSDPDGLGACVALMREVLPGRRRTVHTLNDGRMLVDIYADDAPLEEGIHALETHATLLAIIAALIAEEEAKEKADV